METLLKNRDLVILKIQSVAVDHLVNRLSPDTPEEKEAVRNIKSALKKIGSVVNRLERSAGRGIITRDEGVRE